MRHVMVDIEGLGASPDGVVLSIGACEFDFEGYLGAYVVPRGLTIPEPGPRVEVDYLHVNISIQSSLNVGLKADGHTIKWWLGGEKDSPDQDARDSLWYPEPLAIRDALSSFRGFLGSPKEVTLWANPTAYDLTMLSSSYKALNQTVPWSWKRAVDCQSYTRNVPRSFTPFEQYGVKHHPVWDCCRQAMWIRKAESILKTPTPIISTTGTVVGT